MTPGEDSESFPDDVMPDLEVPVLDEESGRAVLAEFFKKLTFSEDDEKKQFENRGLTSVTSEALQYRSNPRGNQQIIETMAMVHGWPAMIASGLALPADPERKLSARANSQFCGKGRVAKIPKAERANPNIKVKWGWNEPVLIPYFGANGALAALRPHKGGAPAGTAAGSKLLYIPRAFGPLFDIPEKFETVVITEGEFKAAALWQTLGVGACQFVDKNNRTSVSEAPYGVCALPGITYARHVETRTMLEEWLQSVECRRIIIGFDHEIKWDPKLPSYEVDPTRRYESKVYAFYLASDLSQKLRLQGKVCVLPTAWMNSSGKADWDGALAAIVHGKISVNAG